MQRKIIGLCATIAVTLAAGEAGAWGEGLAALGAVVLVADLTLVGTTIGAAAKNGSAIAKGRQATSGWHVAGYWLGGISLALGGWLTASMGNAIGDEPAYGDTSSTTRVMLGIGLVHLALGATSITLAAVSERYPDPNEAPRRALSVAPYVAPTNAGDAQYGLALAGRF